MRRRCVAFLVIIILLTVSTAAYGFIWPIGNSYTPHHSLVNLDPLLGIILLTIGNIFTMVYIVHVASECMEWVLEPILWWIPLINS